MKVGDAWWYIGKAEEEKNMNLTQPRCDKKNIIHDKDEFHMDPRPPSLYVAEKFQVLF